MALKPLHFIGKPIAVEYDVPPALEKKPTCPARLVIDEQVFQVVELVSEWVENARKGRMARNMKPAHAVVAAHRGSWGVGRYYFRVKVATGQIFEIYYDRSPVDVDTRSGGWTLTAEFADYSPE